MRKLLIISMFVCMLGGALFVAAPTVSAVDVLQGVCDGGSSAPDICKDNRTTGTNPIYGADGILTSLIRILSYVVGIIAVITIIIAGLKMITSGGDASGVTTARRALLYAVIGLLFAAIAQIVIIYVLNDL